MRKQYKMLAVILSLMLILSACSTKGETVQNSQKGEAADAGKTEQTSEDAKKDDQEEDTEELKNQAKLRLIEPTAYQEAKGLKLEEGAFISVIGKGAEGQFWEEVEKGAMQAAEDLNEALGYTGKKQVKVTYSGPSEENNVDEQVNILDEELARYPVALSISIADMQACGVQFDLAGQGDIPIVAFDSSSDYPGLNATVSTDNTETSMLAADRLAELMGGSGEVILFVQDSKSQTAMSREDGFTKQLQENYPDISICAVYHMDEMEIFQQEMVTSGVTDKAADEITEEEVVDYLFKLHPEVRGCYATNSDTVKLALGGIDRNNLSPFFVGYDGDTEELEAMTAGKVDGLIVQNPYGMGYAAVIAAARASLSLGNEAVIDTGYVWVTKDNMEDKEVRRLLY